MRLWTVLPLALLLPTSPSPTQAACDDPLLDFLGETFGHEFGTAIADVGDFNDDGIHDIVSGAPRNPVGGADAGMAFLFLGGYFPDDLNDLRFVGEEGDFLGFSVSAAGDFNVDGVDDLILGAPSQSGGTGSARVFFGSETPDNIVDLDLWAGGPGDMFGYAVVTTRDFDGDTFDDLAVSAPLHDHIITGTDAGRVLMYFGTPGGNSVPFTLLYGEVSGDEFGTSLAGGDLNGDGRGDLVVGAPHFGVDAGRAYVFFGDTSRVGLTMNASTADVILSGQTGEFFGRTVATIGDVNADGFGDVCVIAPTDPATGPGGNAYVFFGGPTMDAVPDLTVPIGETGNSMPHGVCHAGDVNNDGVDDFLVGAVIDTGAKALVEVAQIFYGGPDVDAIFDLTINGEQGAFPSAATHVQNFKLNAKTEILTSARATALGRADLWEITDCNGNGIADACDIQSGLLSDCNGNGFADACDIQDGAPDCNANGRPDDCDLNAGTSTDCNGNFIPDECDALASGADCDLNGNPDVCDSDQHFELRGTLPADLFGQAVACAGDVNADGHDDLVVGARAAGSGDQGQARVFLGGPAADIVADLTLTGSATGDWFGAAVAGSQDFNGDGHDDIVVGAPRNDTGPLDGGQAYVFYGGPAADQSADVTLMNFSGPGANAGSSLAMGDVNGDEFADVVVGAPSQSGAGQVLVYYGGSHPSGTQLFSSDTLTGRGGQDRFGTAVACLDLNGDDVDDIAVGSYYPNSQGPGLVEVFFGGGGLGGSDVAFAGGQFDDQFGRAVGNAGDVNGDGFDDLLVGAPLADSNGHDAGRAYLFLGAPAPDSTPDLEVSPVFFAADRHMGIAVAGAGDLNGDGYADIVIGEDGGFDTSAPGRAYVYFGGENGVDATVDRIVAGNTIGDHFGEAVGAAGDFNADGLADLAVGLPWWSGQRGQVHILDAGLGSVDDCNGNGVGDVCDISSGTSLDSNGNGIPDECEPTAVVADLASHPRLLSCSPNPFNPSTHLRFQLPVRGPVRLAIYDVRGRRVRTLADGRLEAGDYQVRWDGAAEDGTAVASGVYHAVLEAGAVTSARKITLLK